MIPDLPLLYSDPDVCPWMLVVDYYLVYILLLRICVIGCVGLVCYRLVEFRNQN